MPRLEPSPLPLVHRLSGLCVLAVVACESEPPEDRPDASFQSDASGSVDGAEEPALDPCQVEIEPITMRHGARVEIEFGMEVMATMTQLEASAALEAEAREDAVSVWASYAASAESVTLERTGCNPLTVPIEVRPLEWSLLSSWTPGVDVGPPAREYGAWSIAQLGGRRGLFVVGGFHYFPQQFTPANDVWFYDLERRTWNELDDTGSPLTPGGRFAAGPEANSLLLLGGARIAADGSLETPRQLQIFRYGDGALHWEEAPFSSEGPGSYTGAFVRDAKRDRWLSVCGVDTNELGVHCAVAGYGVSSGWRAIETAGTPPPGRYGFHYAFDQENDRIVLVGGQSGGQGVYGDTWALELAENPPRWVQLFIEDAAVKRRNGAFAYDPKGHRLFLWGGTADGETAVPGLSILRLDRAKESWVHIDTPDSVPSRASGIAAYDEEAQRIVMGFGNARALYTDLYELSL